MSESGVTETATGLAASKAAAYGGSAVGAINAWFGSIDLAFWISIFIALAGLAMNWYFARKKDKRDAIEHRAYLESLKERCNVE
ncbi:MAG: holin [Acinetobacter sp.]